MKSLLNRLSTNNKDSILDAINSVQSKIESVESSIPNEDTSALIDEKITPIKESIASAKEELLLTNNKVDELEDELQKVNKLEDELNAEKKKLIEHIENNDIHVSDQEKKLWSQAASQLVSTKTVKLNKDENGIFTRIEKRRKSDNTLIAVSELSGGTSPKYATRTMTRYNADGVTVINSDIFALSYDEDGELISEV